jgi:hypothetical protein
VNSFTEKITDSAQNEPSSNLCSFVPMILFRLLGELLQTDLQLCWEYKRLSDKLAYINFGSKCVIIFNILV